MNKMMKIYCFRFYKFVVDLEGSGGGGWGGGGGGAKGMLSALFWSENGNRPI